MGTQWEVIMFQLLFNLELGTFMSSNLKNDVWQFIEKAVTVITIQNIVKYSNGAQFYRNIFLGRKTNKNVCKRLKQK